MGDLTQFPAKPGRPRKPRGNATVSVEDLNSDDEVKNLEALKLRMSQMLAKADVSERDFASISRSYRQVIVELKEARDRAEAGKLGRRRGLTVAGGRAFDGDI